MKIGTLAFRILTIIVLTWIYGTTTSAAPQDTVHWPDARFSVGPLLAFNGLIQYYRDDRLLFEMQDDAPYRRGWFGLRTTESHLEVRHLRIYRLIPPPKH